MIGVKINNNREVVDNKRRNIQLLIQLVQMVDLLELMGGIVGKVIYKEEVFQN